MPRVKRGSKRREKRKKLLSLAKGYFLNKGKLYRAAKEAVDRAGNFAYVGPLRHGYVRRHAAAFERFGLPERLD